MRVTLVLSALLLAWSVVADLMIGERWYTARNLALTALLLVAWWLMNDRRIGRTADEVGLAPQHLRSGFAWGGLAFVAVSAVIGVGVLLADTVGPIGALLADERTAMFADDLWFVALVRIPLGTAVFEEVAFRGVLLAAAQRVLSTWRAVTLSSVVFGLWHIPPAMVALWINDVAATAPEGVAAIAGIVVGTTIAGVGFSALRLVSRSLVAPILAHVATNSVSLLAAVHVQGLG